MESGLADIKREHVGEVDNAAKFQRDSRDQRVNRRWGPFTVILALTFAVVISSCDEKIDTKKQAEDNRLPEVPASANRIFYESDENLLRGAETSNIKYKESGLGDAGITGLEWERRKEAFFGNDLKCIVTIVQNQKTKKLSVSISAPVIGNTYQERIKQAQSAEASEQLAWCREKLAPILSTAGTKSSDIRGLGVGIGAADASNGSCTCKQTYGGCGATGDGACCC